MKLNDLADDPEDVRNKSAERTAAASRSTWISVGVNVVLCTAQIAAGILSKSQALIADGIHSLSDLVSDFVVLIASHLSNQRVAEIFLAEKWRTIDQRRACTGEYQQLSSGSDFADAVGAIGEIFSSRVNFLIG